VVAKTILIIDDEKSVRRTLSRFLEREGYEVKTANGVEEARGLISGADLVLSDIRMGDGINGLEYLEELKAQGFETPIFLMSGIFDFAESERAIQLTGHPVIPKPVEFAALSEFIKKVLQK